MKHYFFKIALYVFFSCFFINSAYGAAPNSKQLRCKAVHKPYIPSNKELGEWEERLVKLINQIRHKHGLGDLKMNKILSDPARTHSSNMAAGKVEFGHEGFKDRTKAIFKLRKHNSVGENVAYNYRYTDPVQVAIDDWMGSPGHKENILGDYDETGVGIVFSKEGRCYFTQLFARTRKK